MYSSLVCIEEHTMDAKQIRYLDITPIAHDSSSIADMSIATDTERFDENNKEPWYMYETQVDATDLYWKDTIILNVQDILQKACTQAKRHFRMFGTASTVYILVIRTSYVNLNLFIQANLYCIEKV